MSQTPLEQVSWKGRKRRLAAGFGALAIIAALFAAVFGNAMRATNESRVAERWHVHTLEVLLTIEAVKAAANGGMRGERGYLITSDQGFLKPWIDGQKRMPELIAKLADQTRDNARQRAGVTELRRRTARLFRVLGMAISFKRAGRDEDAVNIVRRGMGRHEIEGVFETLAGIEAEERRLLAERSAHSAAADQQISDTNRALAMIGFVLICVAGAAGISTARAQKRVRQAAERLRESATTDELTGLANRRAFMQTLDVETARAERSGAPLSVAVLDLDHFKKVNDRYGHAGGDEVLRGFADLARDTMRLGDVVARLGGEEFAILMPSTDLADAERACERLRAKIAEAHFPAPGGETIKVTLSTGIALLVAGEERDRLVTRADDALYRAKEGGRNRVLLAAAA